MRAKRWGSLLLAAGTVAALAGVATSARAGTGQTLTIGVGGDRVVSGVTVEGMRFEAPTLNVHQGDTLTFQFRGFHTATLLPDNISAVDWRAQNQGPGGTYGLIQPDADDSPPAFQFSKAALFPSNPSCGATANPCSYNGTQLVNSGGPFQSQTFSVTVDDHPGSSFWVICLVHTMMQLQVNVVPNGSAATTQTAINNFAKSKTAAENEQIAALIPRLEKQTSHKVGKHRVWDAFVGFDGEGWGLDAMFPKTLHIKKGQSVRWHWAQLLGNIHTVTFPRSVAVAYANKDFSGNLMKCEGASGDTAVNAPPPTFCSTGGFDALELEVRAGAIVKVGTNKYAGHGIHSSGVRGPDAGNVAPYTLKFTHKSGKRGFAYACAVHGGMMSGHVIVKR